MSAQGKRSTALGMNHRNEQALKGRHNLGCFKALPKRLASMLALVG